LIDEELGMFTTRTPHGYSPSCCSELGTAELFVLSSLRLWFLSHCDRDHEYPDWRQAFQAANISARGTWGFDRLCCIVGTTTLRSLDVHWLQCARVGEYEACLLKTIGLLQHNQLEAAEAALLEWCPAAAVRLALEPAHALATALQSHCLWISIRAHGHPPGKDPGGDAGPRASTALPGSALLH
jgi:hypothetical protein